MPKHDHRLAILSHTLDNISMTLLGCQEHKCMYIEVWDSRKMKVKIGERKYRKMSLEELAEKLNPMPHLCCQTPT